MIKANEKVRKWRGSKGLTLKQASEYLEISTSYLSELETGVKPFTRSIIEVLISKAPEDFTPADFFPSAPAEHESGQPVHA